MCVGERARACVCVCNHVKRHPRLLHLVLPPLLSSLTVINDPQLSGTLLTMLFLSLPLILLLLLLRLFMLSFVEPGGV